jgi:hypothetical protein
METFVDDEVEGGSEGADCERSLALKACVRSKVNKRGSQSMLYLH